MDGCEVFIFSILQPIKAQHDIYGPFSKINALMAHDEASMYHGLQELQEQPIELGVKDTEDILKISNGPLP